MRQMFALPTGDPIPAPALADALRATLDRHHSTGGRVPECAECAREARFVPWPCPTVQDIHRALSGGAS